MAGTSAHNKEVKYLVGTESFVLGIENGQFQGVDDAADSVNYASTQQPQKRGAGEGVQ